MNRVPPKQSSDSFWLTQAKFENVKTADPITAEQDVIIIGGGISGVSTAYFLKKYGVPNVLLLESRGIASGATGRNGGHLWSKAPTLDRFKQFGMEQVKKMIDFETETVELVVDFITANNVPCDFRRCGSVSLTSKDEEALEMKHTIQLLKQLPGFKDLPVEYLDAEQIQRFTHGSTAYKGGILSKNAGQLWPAKLIFFVVQKALDLGLNLWTQTTVTQVRKEKNIYVISASRDGKVVQFRAKSVVYATNGYADGTALIHPKAVVLIPRVGLLPQLKDIIVPVRGQAITTSPIKPIIPHNLSMNDGYEYMIHREDGRIVLGGMRWKSKNDMERNLTDDSQISQDVSKGLRDMLPEKFPYLKQHKYTIENEWSGVMGFSTDENPLIGAISPVERITVDKTRTGAVMSGEYILAGYTGYGMPICFGAGKAVAEMVIGLQDPFKFIEAYSPQRYEVFRKSIQQPLRAKM